MKQSGRNLGANIKTWEFSYLLISDASNPGSLFEMENKRACSEKYGIEIWRCKTFLISYNNILFVNCSASHLLMICFVPEKTLGLKLFAFSSYSNSWELADSIGLLPTISYFLKIFISCLSYPLALEYQNLDQFFLPIYFIILHSVIVFSPKSMSF